MIDELFALARDLLDEGEIVDALVRLLDTSYQCGAITGQSSDYGYPFSEDMTAWIVGATGPQVTP